MHKNKNNEEQIWKMFFDGSSSREGLGGWVVLISHSHETIPLSYKLEFETTNNIAKYESLVFSLSAEKHRRIENIQVFWDFELIIQYIKNVYQTKQKRLKLYRNEVWDLIDNFFLAFNILYISRDSNQLANYLATIESGFKSPLNTKIVHEI